MLPNFVIGGATAAGTSFLGHLLLQHDDIFMPKNVDAEPHFFSLLKKYSRGLEWYQKWFDDHQHQKAVGERSSTYLHFPIAAMRLKEYVPSIKLIFVLRNPVDRAWAHYRYMVLRGIEDLGFDSALEREEIRREHELKIGVETGHFNYMGRSYYGQQLEQYLKFFPINQMLILSSENLRNQTVNQLEKVTEFLGIKPLKNFQIISDFASLTVKDPKIQYNARQYFGAKKSRAIIEAIRHKKSDLSHFITNDQDLFHITQIQNNLCEFKEEISPHLKDFLMDHFKKDQIKFFELLKSHLDFDHWY